jgi:phenylpropionate dioxygenase-like ring-hydroxylating dioxygenase large terminal subunit
MRAADFNPSTYTRDLPYGWDSLVENLIDPSHVPFAHHGLQGKRDDAIPINMTVPDSLGEQGFRFEWQDRTSRYHCECIGIAIPMHFSHDVFPISW